MADFRPDRKGLREYLHSEPVYRALDTEAALVEARAKGYARVETALSAAQRNRVPGKFRDSIHRERHSVPSRGTVRVVADCEGAAPIEARDRVLGRAAG